MAALARGTFFDGGSARRRAVEVSLTAQGVEMLRQGGGRELWSYADLEPPEPLPGGGARLSLRHLPEARLVIEEAGFHAELTRLMPRMGGRFGRWRRHRLEIAVIVLTVAAMVGAVLAVPLMSRPLARVMPAAWEERLGRSVEAQFTGGGQVCQRPEGVAALQALVALFPIEARYPGSLTVRVIDRKPVNAFAGPGGRVFLMNGLLQAARSPDEVAGVLAHELGHVVERHPTANAIRQFGISALLTLVLGDGSSVIDYLGEIGGVMLVLVHTRADEAAADRVALELLREAGVDAGGFADFFARLEEKETAEGGMAGLAGYFNSHPPTAERRERARAEAGAGMRPALTPEQWRALRNICGAPASAE